MAFSVNTNIASLFGQRMLSNANNAQATAMERLSSGLRINSAKDDAAGLAISTGFNSQIRGLNQSVRNANDGISALQVADATLGEMTNNLQRVRELSIQAANGIYSASDKASIQAEIGQILQEINTVADTTAFNGAKLFVRGDKTPEYDIDKQAVIDGLFGSWLASSEKMIADSYGLVADGVEMKINLQDTADPNVLASVSGTVNATTGQTENLYLNIDMTDFPKGYVPNGGTQPYYSDRIVAHEMVHAVMGRTTNFNALPTWFKEGSAELIQGADERVYNDLIAVDGNNADHFNAADMDTLANELSNANSSWDGSSLQYSTSYAAVRYLHNEIKSNGGQGIKDVMEYLSNNIDTGADLDSAFAYFSSAAGGYLVNTSWSDNNSFVADFATNGGTFIKNNFNFSNLDTGAISGLDVDGGAELTAESVVDNEGTLSLDPTVGFKFSLPTKDNIINPLLATRLNLQVGSESGQAITTELFRVDTNVLGLDQLDVTQDANAAISLVDSALSYLLDQQSTIGATLNRLAAVVSVNSQTSLKLSASNSRILDADFALETSILTKQQVLQQSSTAMLAQANNNQTSVLSLLG